MAKWKFCRQFFGNEEYTFTDGEKISIGRAFDNTITLSSIVISRNHCLIELHNNKVVITDLKSSNGVYVGLTKIPANSPYTLKDNDIVGLGWTKGAPLVNIDDNEKYVFKLVKQNSPLLKRLKIEDEIDATDCIETIPTLLKEEPKKKLFSDTSNKRKHDIDDSDENSDKTAIKKSYIKKQKEDVISITDSDSDIQLVPAIKQEPIKIENDVEFEAFNIKQEYLGYDDEAIEVDSDSETESDHWFLRLSQSSPGKPFIKVTKKEIKADDSSYSQIDDPMNDSLLDDHEDDYLDDLIYIPSEPPNKNDPAVQEKVETGVTSKLPDISNETYPTNKLPDITNEEDFIQIPETNLNELQSKHSDQTSRDVIDGVNTDCNFKILEGAKPAVNDILCDTSKKTQIIHPLEKPQRKAHSSSTHSKSKKSSGKDKKHSSSKKVISHSQKEERKKKLKELAVKEKEMVDNNLNKNASNNSSKQKVNVKVTNCNRGAFLTDSVQIVKPTKRKESPSSHKKDKSSEKSPKESNTSVVSPDISNSDIDYAKDKKHSSKSKISDSKISKHKDRHHSTKRKSHSKAEKSDSVNNGTKLPLKSLKPLSESEESFSGKPFSKVVPLPPAKPKKSVRFSEAPPRVHIFEIQPGNRMKKTSLVKTTLVDQLCPNRMYSLEKIMLIKILRWNPSWLKEQMNNKEPPPILGHSNPMALLHSFRSHNQYVQLVGDLLLMEIWECLTQGYKKIHTQRNGIQMRIESLPPAPVADRCLELYNMSVNVSVPTTEIKSVPRVGEILQVSFGPENSGNLRFFFVHNVRRLPSPPNNIHSFFSISLHATFTERMRMLRPGEVMVAKSLAYINNELMLFEAIEYLAGSPLSAAILRPEPQHFPKPEITAEHFIQSKWTATLNPSQQAAVSASVGIALSERPAIQMVQGPPGTGKSSVICAIVMSYFYDVEGRRQNNRGKILICATSNAAVDELVIRLLKIRQSLPKGERFDMVRVGRAESMHASAHNVSSQRLAQRQLAKRVTEPARPGLGEEISHLEAKMNMWRTAAQDAKDPVRVAYCQDRAQQIYKRIALFRSGGGASGGGDDYRAEDLSRAERMIIEGAHIVVTTLSSAFNHKMKGLKGRIALCIVDEAGQAIEPEALIPLTLDVTHLALIGDPQQLPGFICSQRAKQHGLGESLFSRLTSSSELWPSSPVVLLDQQYRMHREIADYPNRAFYAGKIRTMVATPPDLGIPPYVIVGITSGDKGQEVSGANDTEACGVARLVCALRASAGERALSLAVLTPYAAHRDLVRRHLARLQDGSSPPVEVNTVDSFQGQERDVVVVSLARSQGVGFLTDAGRMNVMLTRAKHALIVCLNPHAILKHNQWRTLVEDAQRRKLYTVLPKKIYQDLSVHIPDEEVLKHIQHKSFQ